MLSLTTFSTHLLVSSCSLPNLSSQSHSTRSILLVASIRRKRLRERFAHLSSVAPKKNGGCGGGGEPGRFSGLARRCLKWDSEGDFALEGEILEFMKESRSPEAFPSKKELVEAGRMDLVDAIVDRGGWLSLGWDLNDEENEKVQDNVPTGVSYSSSADKECGGVFNSVVNGIRSSGMVPSFSGNSSPPASSSGRSLETAVEDESGIEGILNRLEKQRNMTFGFGLREQGNDAHFPSNHCEDDWHPGTSIDTTVARPESSSELTSLSSNMHIENDLRGKLDQNRSLLDGDGLVNSLKPDMWRTWSIQRAGFSDASFEAAEIAYNETRTEGPMDGSGDKILEIRDVTGESFNTVKELGSSPKEINHNEIRSRLQHLESELSFVLLSLRSNADKAMSQQGHESSPKELRNLSDAWEFQENEIMNAQGRLRSIRAKLAVLEGKMALAIIDAQKMVEEKQKRIDDNRRALQHLRTTCIVWVNPASVVLLAGSFDGWATQMVLFCRERWNSQVRVYFLFASSCTRADTRSSLLSTVNGGLIPYALSSKTMDTRTICLLSHKGTIVILMVGLFIFIFFFR
ncbi:hypothetical protein F2P56_030135 [Juglans regia]|uniref:Protein PTST homolog 2, chloroplastic-like n=1 Tax=Juglans regia TaxID=51240 RepID=A0A833U3L3_JUGRE|nr:hypothetical protein F2P56_030135 [Juglans regia]